MTDRLFRHIIGLTDKLKKDMEAVLPQIQANITAIISENNKDIKKIENLLDILLNYGQMGVGEAEFRRLNTYYASFNAENAKFYSDAYDEE
ncbi:MAG: hypothetical protein KJ955_05570 [Nanoarchaeota archaeon]|nr:hypothetical protein [Nanoarchaeota archaeon]